MSCFVKRSLLAMCGGLAVVPSLHAQDKSDLTDVNFYPPSAVSMMKYIDYPVSYRTGIPDITIPLYTVRSGNLELPVDLSFHLDDFTRVNQMAGAAGAGWALSCDLQVSRVINGVDDFLPAGYLQSGISRPDVSSTTFLRPAQDRLMALWNKDADEDPDKFFYKLPGGGGSFYIEKTLGVKTVPITGDKITYDKTGDNTFVITGTDGSVYYFSGSVSDTAADTQSGLGSGTAWKCTKVESADGANTITFSYLPHRKRIVQAGGDVTLYDNLQLYTSSPLVGEAVRSPRQEWRGSGGYWKTMYFGLDSEDYGPTDLYWMNAPDQTTSISAVYKWVRNYYVDRIVFRGGRLQFEYREYDAGRTQILNPALSRIVVYDNQGTVRKTIVFTQDGVAQTYERYLSSVKAGNDIYSFNYNYNKHIGDVFPDFWGYASNGHYSGGLPDVPFHATLISPGSGPTDVDGNRLVYPTGYFDRMFGMPSDFSPNNIYRTPNEEKTILGVTYPTGGRTDFVCEHNQFRDRDAEDRRISSYRIKYIRYYDKNNTLLKEMRYAYGQGENGCGVIRREPDFDDGSGNCHTLQELSYYYTPEGTSQYNTLGATIRRRTYLPGLIYRTNYDDGSHIQYDEVAEYRSAGGILSGKTVYKYDLGPKHDRPVRENYAYPAGPYPMQGEDWYLGMLDSVIRYKYDGGRFEWVTRLGYAYDRYDDPQKIFCARVWASRLAIVLGPDMGGGLNSGAFDFQYSYNGIQAGCMQLRQEDFYERRDDGRVLKRITRFYYDTPNHYTPSRREIIHPDGRTVTSQTLYAEDYPASGVRDMLVRNLVSLPMEQVERTNGIVTAGSTSVYDSYGRPNTLSGLTAPDLAQSAFRLSNKTRTGDFSAGGTGAYSPDSRYTGKASFSYDADGNICQVQAEGQPPVCYLWGYKGMYLVAEIRNATYEQLKAVLGVGIDRIRESVVLSVIDQTALNLLRSQHPDWHVTTATYIPLVGMQTLTDPSGRKTTYTYNSLNHLVEVRDHQGKTVAEYDYSSDH